jgi:hypothetical protein
MASQPGLNEGVVSMDATEIGSRVTPQPIFHGFLRRGLASEYNVSSSYKRPHHLSEWVNE